MRTNSTTTTPVTMTPTISTATCTAQRSRFRRHQTVPHFSQTNQPMNTSGTATATTSVVTQPTKAEPANQPTSSPVSPETSTSPKTIINTMKRYTLTFRFISSVIAPSCEKIVKSSMSNLFIIAQETYKVN